jgi:hypothetical protein
MTRSLAAFGAVMLCTLPGMAQAAGAGACEGPGAVCTQARPGALHLIAAGRPARVITDPADDEAVRLAAQNLAGDLAKVGGGKGTQQGQVVLIGTRGHSPAIDRLIAQGKIDANRLSGAWEGYVAQVVANPMPGVDRALVIVGSDRRGTIFGTYDLSRRAGVSPWTWWADVPVRHQASLFVSPGARFDKPAVHDRGIFLNDEDPSLSGWAKARFGGLNHQFYTHVFELVLRLKGDMIWPAMWGKSLWDDDPESAALAQRMGIVLGTSHHEPLLRAHVEWERYGKGPWDYTQNAAVLQDFWRKGLERNAGRDAIVTVGMRGDGDKPMADGPIDKGAIPLLERIVADQRKIITQVTGKPADQTPQVWALYKEVQDYYDKGMRVPDDVTLLFSDDNWGNIRRLPPAGEHRPGGAGIYYHFDYVGGPRNYKWLNVTQVSRVWEQMRGAYVGGARQLWMANVGDLKPMELPINFFLDFAWNPDAWPLKRVGDYHRHWAAEQFGAGQADAIADILDRTTRYAARRKPELLTAASWDAAGWDRVLGDYARLQSDAEQVGSRLPTSMKDAYFELVLHPVLAMGNLNRLYATVAANQRCAAAGDGLANDYATQAAALFAQDRAIALRYEASAGGKWPHMMDQTHIGYTSWQQPDHDIMPTVIRVAQPKVENSGCGLHPASAAPVPSRDGAFGEQNGRIDIDAAHWSAVHGAGGSHWARVPGLGRTGSAVMLMPQDAAPAGPGQGASLDYAVSLAQDGPLLVQVIAAPSLDTSGAGRLRYAVAIDDEPPMEVNLLADGSEAAWAKSVIASARLGVSRHQAAAGRHVVHIYAIDPGVVIERLVVSRAPIDALALDPPESRRVIARARPHI